MATFPERTNYFFGRLLGVEDFEREQDYLITRLRRHNRYAHGWGVLHGLGVQVVGEAVHVDPGVAIDCEGNELELPARATVDLSALDGPVYIGLRFIETPVSPIPGTEDGGLRYAATREGAELTVDPISACAGHAGQGPGTPGCGLRHAVALARLARHPCQWRVRPARNRAA